MRSHKLPNKTSGDAKSLLIFIICVLATIAFGLNILATNTAGQGNIAGKMDRPIRYRPIGRDFVIENGKEFFNRPLYGGNTAFRIDAGDKPEFSFYMPGRGGNVRIGIKSSKGEKWLIDADRIVSRYRAGSMVYEIRDALFGGGTLVLTALPTHLTEGLLIKVELTNTNETVELITAFGGSDGDRGRRNGDIRGETVPVTEFFQLKPEYCKDSKFAINSNSFTQDGKGGKIAGVAPLSTVFYVADANNWNKVKNLSASPDSPTPVVVGKTRLGKETPLYFKFQKDSAKDTAEELPALFERSEEYRRSIAEKVTVETPDAYVNAAVSALNIAADGIWDEQQSAYMHGAVAWRLRLLGWRGPYAGDALGWHDRLRRHLEFWAGRQNVKPISPGPVKPDPAFNFARNPEELHTNGDISNTHYDMNIVYIDAVFRHLLWTGDVEFAKKLWPVIKRHLAWERRLFRREYGPEKLPLYEAYVCIWASDDLQYGGSGVTHSTAYNYYHQKSAARIARLIGEDPAPYELEADLIQKAMRRNLWLPDQGWYGEYKDLFGLQKVHPSAALWTYYHAVDSETMSPTEAWQMSQYVDTSIPRIPIPNTISDTGDYFTHSTTNWMPYTWSTNNVVLAESTHTALGHWQSGRDETAFRLFKGALLDSMYMGVCPGNVGMSTDFDAARRESFRDFADGTGTTSRALIEGLFGIRPDLLAGELKIGPAFPKVWNSAAINHPDLKFSFEREGKTDTYQIDPKFSKPVSLKLKVAAQRDRIAKVTVNGKSAEWETVEDSVGQPRIEIIAPAAANFKILIEWTGERIVEPAVPQVVPENGKVHIDFGVARIVEISDPQSALSRVSQTSRSLTANAAGKRGHRSVFAKVKQGELTWQQPVMFEIRAPFEVIPSENQIGENLSFKVRNNTSNVLNRPIKASINGKKVSLELKLPAFGLSQEISINGKKHAAGSNSIELDLGEGTNVKGVVTNWKIKPDTAAEFEHVDLAKVFNDQLGNIFKNEYLSPRSPFVSLAIPKHGIGSWVKFAEQVEIDDSGLRKTADKNGGRIGLPNGVELKTVGMAGGRNIAFTSQWDNFPREITVPLNGRASHIYLLMAGSTNQMQSRFDNGEVMVSYEDGSTEQLKLENPTTWWAIDQDYMIDDYAFRRPEAVPPRVDLQTGTVRIVDLMDFKGKGKKVKGGAATVLDLPLRSDKPLKSLTLRTLANEVVIGLMSATLKRN